MSAGKRGRGRRGVESPQGGQAEFPPPPAIPAPQMTEAEIARETEQKAEISRLLRKLADDALQNNLDRAVRLAQMAARRQGALVEFFQMLGVQYYKWADEGPQEPSLRAIEGGAD
jgi:hypothetical protein